MVNHGIDDKSAIRMYEGMLPAPKAYTPFCERQNANMNTERRRRVRLLGIAPKSRSGRGEYLGALNRELVAVH